MKRIEKTVFISYRRTNAPWALAISQNLKNHGYDVFFDFQGIDSGDFAQVILENVRARAHFIVLLTPSALEHCSEPGDWLRQEIETALKTKRNIVPLMLEGFDFSTPSIADHLTGSLAPLNSYSALRVPADYFDEAMDRLRKRFLEIELEAILHPSSAEARQAAEVSQAAASAAPTVPQEKLTAQDWFECGFKTTDLKEKIRCNTEALRLNPDFADAYNNRGNARYRDGDVEGALLDYDYALRLKPNDAITYYNRGNARQRRGDLDDAEADYDEAIRRKPTYAPAYNNRGVARERSGNVCGAKEDYYSAIRLRPSYVEAYFNLGNVLKESNEIAGALESYDIAIRLKPDDAYAHNNRGIARKRNNDIDSALEDYNAAISLKPDYADAYYNRAMAYEANGCNEFAIADYRSYLDLRGDLASGDRITIENSIKELMKM